MQALLQGHNLARAFILLLPRLLSLQLHVQKVLALSFQVQQVPQQGLAGLKAMAQGSLALGCRVGRSKGGARESRGRTHAEEVHTAVIDAGRQAKGSWQMERPGTVSHSVNITF